MTNTAETISKGIHPFYIDCTDLSGAVTDHLVFDAVTDHRSNVSQQENMLIKEFLLDVLGIDYDLLTNDTNNLKVEGLHIVNHAYGKKVEYYYQDYLFLIKRVEGLDVTFEKMGVEVIKLIVAGDRDRICAQEKISDVYF